MDIAEGDVVQIDGDDPVFAYCFLTVTECKSWGVQGFVKMPQHPTSVDAYYRVEFKRITRIGRAEFIPAELSESK